MAFKLAELFVEFTTKGVAAVGGALGLVKKDIDAVKEGTRAAGDAGEKSFKGMANDAANAAKANKGLGDGLGKTQTVLEKLQAGAAAFGNKAAWAFALGSASILGFVKSGLSGTTAGELLTYRMQFLSREIASVFLPIVRALSDQIGRLVDWFRKLTGGQQENIRTWVLAGLGALAFMKLVPLVIGGIGSIIGAIGALSTAASVFDVLTGGILPLIGVLVTAAAGMSVLAAGTEEGQSAFKELWEAVKPIGKALMDLFNVALKAAAPILAAVGQTAASFLGMLADGLQQIVPLVSKLFEALRPIGEVIAFAFRAMVPVFQAIQNAVSELIDAMMPLVTKIASDINAAFEAAKPYLQDFIQNGIEVLIGGIKFLVDGFKMLISVIEDVYDAMQDLGIVDGIIFAWQAVAAAVKQALEGMKVAMAAARVALAVVRDPSLAFSPARLKALFQQYMSEMKDAAKVPDALKPRAPEERPEREDVTLKGGGFESFADTWRRIQTAAMKTDQIPQKQLKVQEEIRDGIGDIRGKLKFQPAVAR